MYTKPRYHITYHIIDILYYLITNPKICQLPRYEIDHSQKSNESAFVVHVIDFSRVYIYIKWIDAPE